MVCRSDIPFQDLGLRGCGFFHFLDLSFLCFLFFLSFLSFYLSSSILSGIETHVHINSLSSMDSLVCDESHYQRCFGGFHRLRKVFELTLSETTRQFRLHK